MLLTNKQKGFFIKDILSPSFGTINAEKRNNTVLNSSKLQQNICESDTGFQLSKTFNTENNSVVRNENFGELPKENCDMSPHDKKFWPSWVFCTRYSDRPSSGCRSRKEIKKAEKKSEEKRPRTAFTSQQLSRLQQEFNDSKYLTDSKRKTLAGELELKESQIKIWFQNKRAKIKKSTALHISDQPKDIKNSSLDQQNL